MAPTVRVSAASGKRLTPRAVRGHALERHRSVPWPVSDGAPSRQDFRLLETFSQLANARVEMGAVEVALASTRDPWHVRSSIELAEGP